MLSPLRVLDYSFSFGIDNILASPLMNDAGYFMNSGIYLILPFTDYLQLLIND